MWLALASFCTLLVLFGHGFSRAFDVDPPAAFLPAAEEVLAWAAAALLALGLIGWSASVFRQWLAELRRDDPAADGGRGRSAGAPSPSGWS